MSSNEPQPSLQALRCPSCGAALPDGGARVECAFCGTVVDVRRQKQEAARAAAAQANQASQPQAGAARRSPTITITQTQRKRSGASCLASLIVTGLILLLGFGAAGYLLLRTPGAGSGQGASLSLPVGPRLFSTRHIDLLPAADGAQPQLVALVRSQDDSAYHLARIDQATNQRVWIGPALSDQALSYANTAITTDTVVFSDNRTLHGFALADGARRWETQISDWVCEGCLVAAGGSAIAMTADFQVQAVDLASGELLWSYDLGTYADRSLTVVGDEVVVFARDEQVDAEVLVFSPSDGTIVRRFSPACGDEVLSQDMIEADEDDPHWVDASTGTLVMITYEGETCVHAYDLASGEQRWQTMLGTESSDFSNDGAFVRAGDELLFGAGSLIYAANLQSGEARQIVSEADYNLSPLSAHDGILAAVAIRARGTQRAELWGIDLQSGKRLWRREFKGDGERFEAPMEAAGTLSDNEEVWGLVDTSAGMTLLVLADQPHRYTVEVLDPRTGAPTATRTIERPEESAIWIPDMAARAGDTLYVEEGSKLLALDLAQGTVVYEGP